MVCLQRFLTALLIIPAAIADTSTGTDFIIHAKKFTGGAWSGRDFFDLLKEVLQPTLELIAPIIDFVVKNPWVLSPLLIPAMNLWLTMIGFEAGGIVAGELDW